MPDGGVYGEVTKYFECIKKVVTCCYQSKTIVFYKQRSAIYHLGKQLAHESQRAFHHRGLCKSNTQIFTSSCMPS